MSAESRTRRDGWALKYLRRYKQNAGVLRFAQNDNKKEVATPTLEDKGEESG